MTLGIEQVKCARSPRVIAQRLRVQTSALQALPRPLGAIDLESERDALPTATLYARVPLVRYAQVGSVGQTKLNKPICGESYR